MAAHLKNACKYFLSITSQVLWIVSQCNKDKFYIRFIFICVMTASTVFSYGWDITMDWGLMRTLPNGGRTFLRPKILYPSWFYYFAAITNLFLRFLWIMTLFNYSEDLKDSQLIPFLMSLFEILRRAQWSLLRIENENVNNFERYRNILQIPDFDEDVKK